MLSTWDTLILIKKASVHVQVNMRVRMSGACAYVPCMSICMCVYAHVCVCISMCVDPYAMNNARTIGVMNHHHELGARGLVGVVQNENLRCNLIYLC